jgi:hypothetical protein
VENSIVGKFTGAQNHEVSLVCDTAAGAPGSLVSVAKDVDQTWLLTWKTSAVCPKSGGGGLTGGGILLIM